MSRRNVDLRSDFVARPTPEMIARAGEAALREAAFLPWEDSLVQELETAGAALLGRQYATFAINCTTANYLALSQRLGRYDRLVLAGDSHVVRNEAGLLAFLDRRKIVVAPDAPEAAAALLREGRRVLLCIENTQLYACGRALDAADLKRLRDLHREAAGRLGLHLDGSRLFNAWAHQGYGLARDFDFVETISLSLNKGLAAPIGALLVGDRELIAACNEQALAEARIVRPAHIPAAYGLAALRQTLPGLAEDNRRAGVLARALPSELEKMGYGVEYGGTNILFLTGFSGEGAAGFVRASAAVGLLARVFRDPCTARLVVHRDIDDDCLERISTDIPRLCAGLPPGCSI